MVAMQVFRRVFLSGSVTIGPDPTIPKLGGLISTFGERLLHSFLQSADV